MFLFMLSYMAIFLPVVTSTVMFLLAVSMIMPLPPRHIVAGAGGQRRELQAAGRSSTAIKLVSRDDKAKHCGAEDVSGQQNRGGGGGGGGGGEREGLHGCSHTDTCKHTSTGRYTERGAKLLIKNDGVGVSDRGKLKEGGAFSENRESGG